MRGIFAVLAISLAAVLAVVLEHEQQVQAQHSHHEMQHTQAEGVKLHRHDDPAARTITVRLGPLNLSSDSDHSVIAQAPDDFFEIPFDGWLIAYHPRVTDPAGNSLPGLLLHHVGFFNISRSDFLCPNKPEHIFGAGSEMTDWSALPGFGYAVARGDRILVNTMFHNPTATSYPEVYLEVVAEYRRADSGMGIKNVYPAWFNVMECGNSAYDLEPGSNVTTARFTLRHSGILLGAGGHLHDYGTRLDLVNTTRDEPIVTVVPRLDEEGRIQSIPIVTFLERGGSRLRAGETISVTAVYENSTGKPLPDGAMGIVVGYFLPDDDSEMKAYARTPR
jgi:hypothetical protein